MKQFSHILILLLVSIFRYIYCVELTFELPDNARQCFYEEISENTKFQIEYQVVTGGHYDVDVKLENPMGQVMYSAIKKQFDTYTNVAPKSGIYKVCFSNEFSTFSHKLIYFDFQVGQEKPLPGVNEHLTAMTLMEASSTKIHENLNTIVDYQTYHRLRETQGRKRAEDLNSRVLYWSIGETTIIISICIFQVLILKSFFTEKKNYVRM